MKKFVVALLSSLTFAAPGAFAQSATPDPATVTAVHQLLDSMKYRDMLRASFDQTRQSLPGIIRNAATSAITANAQLSEEQKKLALAKLETELPKVVDTAASLFNDPKLIDELLAETVPLYARYFTTAEIKEMAAYYKTPLGAKQLAVMPQLMNESMQISQRIINPRIGAMIQKLAQLQ